MDPHQAPAASFGEMFASLWRNRRLVVQLTRRDVVGRYRGSVLGITWSFFSPLLMLAVYTFVFSVVFKAHWGTGPAETKTDFALILFVGMILYGLFAECLNRAPSLILAHTNFVRKVVFPLETLPWMAMGASLFHAAISLLVLVLALLLINHSLPWTALLFPLVLLPLVFLTIGLTWLLASLGVFLRDIAQTTNILTTILMFLSAVFFPLSALPPELQTTLQWNPLVYILEEGRNALIFGKAPDFGAWFRSLAISLMVAWGGFWWFQKTRRGFADVV